MENPEEEEEVWADENLDEEIKAFLAVFENGKDTAVDTISHLEYFYNTLDCDFRTENPFDSPLRFPCLNYVERDLAAPADSKDLSSGFHEKTLF